MQQGGISLYPRSESYQGSMTYRCCAQQQQLRSTPLGEGFHPTFGQIQSPPGLSLRTHPTSGSPTTPVVTTANDWLSASLAYIRLSQVLPRFLSRAVSPVVRPSFSFPACSDLFCRRYTHWPRATEVVVRAALFSRCFVFICRPMRKTVLVGSRLRDRVGSGDARQWQRGEIMVRCVEEFRDNLGICDARNSAPDRVSISTRIGIVNFEKDLWDRSTCAEIRLSDVINQKMRDRRVILTDG